MPMKTNVEAFEWKNAKLAPSILTTGQNGVGL
jgi:hypothetical protein